MEHIRSTVTDFKSWYNAGVKNPQNKNAIGSIPSRGRNHKPFDAFMRKQHAQHVPFWVALSRWADRCKLEQQIVKNAEKGHGGSWPYGTDEQEFITIKAPHKKPKRASTPEPSPKHRNVTVPAPPKRHLPTRVSPEYAQRLGI